MHCFMTTRPYCRKHAALLCKASMPMCAVSYGACNVTVPLEVLASKNHPSFEHECISPHSCNWQMAQRPSSNANLCWACIVRMLLEVYASKDNLLFEHKCTSSHSCNLQMGTTLRVQSWYISYCSWFLNRRILVSVQQMHLIILTCLNLVDNVSACKTVYQITFAPHQVHRISYIRPCSSSSHKKRPAYKFKTNYRR